MSSVLIANAQADFHGTEPMPFPVLDLAALRQLIEQELKRPQTSEQEEALILHDASCKCLDAGDYTAFEEFRAKIGEKSLSPDLKVEHSLALARYYIYKRDYSAALAEVEKYKQEEQISFDLESQSKVYSACLYLLQKTDLELASNLMVAAISTFSAEELIVFSAFSSICFTLACGFLDRSELRRLCDEQVDAFTECDECVSNLTRMLVNCCWEDFSILLQDIAGFIQHNFFLHAFKDEILEKITAEAYEEYLEAFLATSVADMAADFKIPLETFKRQLEYFIFRGDVRAKIDAVEWRITKVQNKETDRLWIEFEDECEKFVSEIENMQRGK